MKPKICVLMATYNGVEYVIEQIESILAQKNVNVTLFINDDFSSDGTFELIKNLYFNRDHVIILEPAKRHGSAGKNFYSLFELVNFEEFDYIALADQDDIWSADKLNKSVIVLNNFNSDAVSSNVTAFWDAKKRYLIKKSNPQKKYDYIFESAGPGCTYLIKKELAFAIKHYLHMNSKIYCSVYAHDWLIYAYARHNGFTWKIMDDITVQYRQHSTNETGANRGILAKIIRMRKLRSGWYLDQVYSIAKAVGYENILDKIFTGRSKPTIYYIKNLNQMRRNKYEAIVLYLLILLKIAR